MEIDKKLSLETILSGDNLAELLPDDDLDIIGEYVHEGYLTDKKSRESWEGKVDEWTSLALQVVEEKSFPWPNAANVKYPLITTAALQFSARAYPALLPGTNPVRGRVVGYDKDGSKTERAIRIGKHMSYQVLQQMSDWEEEMDRLLFALPIVGCVFKKTYFSASKGHNVSEIVYPKELVVNYWAKNLEEAPRITHELAFSENDIRERILDGRFIEQELKAASDDELPDTNKVSSEAMGMDKPASQDDTTPYIALEQCVYLDLDQDGYKEPYIVTIEGESRKVFRIVPRFDEDQIKYTEKNEVIRIDPTNYYTKFSFVPSPDGGFYDIGFGILLGPINETINTLINQLLDAGTMSVTSGGFIAKGIRIKGGKTSFDPFEWKAVNTVGDDLRKGLVPLPVREPSQVLFSLLGMMIESGEKLSSVTEIMSGDIPGQNTKATVAMAAIEQGMKVFSSIYKRVHRSLAKEYTKLFILNSIFLEPEEYFNILDVGQEGAAQIGLEDYKQEDIDVIPSSDPNIATEQQKIAKIEAIGSLLQMGTINPQEYTKRMLEATEQVNIEALMKMPDPKPNEEFEFEKQKFSDESERSWAEIELKQNEATAKSEREVDAITRPDNNDAESVRKYIADLNAEVDLKVARLRAETDLEIAEMNKGQATTQ